MKTIKKVYLMVQNCGDGSVSVSFFSSESLALWVEKQESEQWAESSVREIIIESDGNEIKFHDLETPEHYLVKSLCDVCSCQHDISGFIDEFFPDGIPKFTVKEDPLSKKYSKYRYLDVYMDDSKIVSVFTDKTTAEVAEILSHPCP